MDASRTPLVLLTGASGYIGGRLLGALEPQTGRPSLSRSKPASFSVPGFLPLLKSHRQIAWTAVLSPRQSAGVHTACYLVHSMGSSGQFVEEDRQAAQNFADAAREEGIKKSSILAD